MYCSIGTHPLWVMASVNTVCDVLPEAAAYSENKRKERVECPDISWVGDVPRELQCTAA